MKWATLRNQLSKQSWYQAKQQTIYALLDSPNGLQKVYLDLKFDTDGQPYFIQIPKPTQKNTISKEPDDEILNLKISTDEFCIQNLFPKYRNEFLNDITISMRIDNVLYQNHVCDETHHLILRDLINLTKTPAFYQLDEKAIKLITLVLEINFGIHI